MRFLANQIPLFSWHAILVDWLLKLSASSIPTLDEYRYVFVNFICLIFADYSKLCQLKIWKLNLLIGFIFCIVHLKLVIYFYFQKNSLSRRISLSLKQTLDLFHRDHAEPDLWINLSTVFICTCSYSCIWHFDIFCIIITLRSPTRSFILYWLYVIFHVNME